MDAKQFAELTGTNRPCGLVISLRQTLMSCAGFGLRNLSPACGYDIGRAISRFPVVFSRRPHPIPSRTRKLSSSEPMVLHGKPCGRVGRCRDYSVKGPPSAGPFFFPRGSRMGRGRGPIEGALPGALGRSG